MIKTAKERHNMMVDFHKTQQTFIETRAMTIIEHNEKWLDLKTNNGYFNATLNLSEEEKEVRKEVARIYKENGYTAHLLGKRLYIAW